MTIAAEYLGWLQVVEQYDVDDEASEEIFDHSLDETPSRAKALSQKYERRNEPEQLSMLTQKGKFRKTSRPQTRPPYREPKQMGFGFGSQDQQRMRYGPPRGTGRTPGPEISPGLYGTPGQGELFGPSGRPTSRAGYGSLRNKAMRMKGRMGQRAADRAADWAAAEMPQGPRGTPIRNTINKMRKALHNIQKSGPTVGLPRKGPIRQHFDARMKRELEIVNREHREFLRDRNAAAKNIMDDGNRRASAKRKEFEQAAKDKWKEIKRKGKATKKLLRSQGKSDAAEIKRIATRRAEIERNRGEDAVASEYKRVKQAAKDIRKEYGLRRSVFKANPKSPHGKGRFGLVKGETSPPVLGEWE